MDPMEQRDPQALEAHLDGARERLEGLARDLEAIEGELEVLAETQRKYALLGETCSALERLGALGAGGLFWDVVAADGDPEEHLRALRGRVDVFEKQVEEVENRRQEVRDAIRLQEESAELFEDELDELRRQEEERQLEWLVERDPSVLPDQPTVMPWTRTGEDDGRFRRTLLALLLVSALLGVIFPLIPLPLPEPWETIEVPDRLTRLIREELPPPPRPAPPPTPEEVEPEQPKLAEETPPDRPQKKSAESKGILAFREKFSGLAASRAPARLGAAARISSAGEAKTGRPTRNMLTSQAPGTSGGIDLASLSREIGGAGGQPEGVAVARVTSSIGGIVGEDRPLSDGPAAGRTDEEIQIVFDRHKAALYRLYNRELRRDPTLQGQMVLRIRIEPDGSVSLCQVRSSDVKAPQLAAQVVERVKTFDFGAKDVPAITILYPIDFLPAT